MCGIVGYVGHKSAVPILLKGLKKLEYRGYDSAGIAVLNSGSIDVVKKVGKLEVLEEHVGHKNGGACIGIGHTRWATHGRPSDTNAHPHTDCTGRFAVVHNGIIENFQELRGWLKEEGHSFKSETDTEVLVHLFEHFYRGDLVTALRQVMEKVEGSYAMVILSLENPGQLIAARQDNPLIVGLGEGENFIASDIPAILEHTRQTYILNDGEVVLVTSDQVQVFDRQGNPVHKEVFHVQWDMEAAEKGGYDHFMIKEICEQPKAIRDTLKGRLDLEKKKVVLKEIGLDKEAIERIDRIFITACGTAYHAGLVGKYVIERMVQIPVEVDIASEFRYRDPLITENSLVIVISQSGETADTLAALRMAQKKGARVLAITNVVGSSVAREADDVIYTWAGPEIAVASTKAYVTQLIAIYLLSCYLGQLRGTVSGEQLEEIIEALVRLPGQAEAVLKQQTQIREMARRWAKWEDAFFIGRSLDYAVAMEGQLKLKEISYIHAEAYAAGELKHGTLALIVEGVPVIVLATQKEVYEKTISNLQEVKARGAYITAVAFESDQEIGKLVEETIYIPDTISLVAPVLTVIPLQLLAYYAAVERGSDVDKPRNLAKSVTVE
ncbi:glutamine--fructose-6-phosphate transaminase (isomerizing) [Calderihabitans maritimus]|uniref:Glutamine--fructose-6-phosphate aminotransferase [isomerizing] n=1 Tax=Calderihabitans maritimus TaxID=1246530 RepID=A0A1Z5HTF3_9FIRM|nr:glutamine--fructose-6-phosphate transaminase (isomerizing) [Calderihabitans maritimus]GAW92550.1 glutamine--fructose-6-phosphate transaminase [Calderihabitans maritimus]